MRPRSVGDEPGELAAMLNDFQVKSLGCFDLGIKWAEADRLIRDFSC